MGIHIIALCGLLFGYTFASTVMANQWQFSHEDPSTTYNYLTTADWGDDGSGQHHCAAGMGAVAAEINAHQVFVLGDNFYPSGIHPSDGVDGVERFKKTFEDVYTADSLANIPFYAIAGNHDHLGNVTAQIAYSTNPQTKRWVFPSYWHNVTQKLTIGGKSVELEVLLFDSVIMAGNTEVMAEDGSVTELQGGAVTGPADPNLAQEQLEWLQERLSSSTADYLWVGGHYPVWAIGRDAPTGVEKTLRPLLNKWEANYFNGHEHDLEYIVENGTKVNYISTGAGKECCYEDSHVNTVPDGAVQWAMSGRGGSEWQPMPFEILSGFTSYRIGPDSMKVYYHAHNGTILHVTPDILPRDHSKLPLPPVGPPGPFYPPGPPAANSDL